MPSVLQTASSVLPAASSVFAGLLERREARLRPWTIGGESWTIRAGQSAGATTSPLHTDRAPRRATMAAMHPAGFTGNTPLRHPHATRIAAPKQADDREHHDLGFAYSNDEASHQNELSSMVSRREPKK